MAKFSSSVAKISRAFFLANEVCVFPINRSNSFHTEVGKAFTIPATMICVSGVQCGRMRISWSSNNAKVFGTLMTIQVNTPCNVSKLLLNSIFVGS